MGPAEEGEDDVGGEGRESRQGDRDTDHPRPERAVIAVVIQLESAAHYDQQGRQGPGRDGVPVQLPAEPPLVDIVVSRHEERLPGPRDEELLEEDLGQVED